MVVSSSSWGTGSTNEGRDCNNDTCKLSNVVSAMDNDGRLDRVKQLMVENGFPQSVAQEEWVLTRPNCWSCVAFATFVYHYLHGTDLLPGAVASQEITIDKTTNLNQFFSDASRGDIIIFDRNGLKSHYAVFLRSDESSVFFYECNIGGTSDIRYNNQNSYTNLLNRYEGNSLQIISAPLTEEDPNNDPIPPEPPDDGKKTIIIPGSLTEQRNVETHSYKAPITGKYLFELIDRTSNYNLNMTINDSLDRECASCIIHVYGFDRDTAPDDEERISVDLKEGEVYTITIYRRNNDLKYKLRINISN